MREWFSWAGGSARACLNKASSSCDELDLLKSHVTGLLEGATTQELQARSFCCSAQMLSLTAVEY